MALVIAVPGPDPHVVIYSELALLAILVVAVLNWWVRCDRAVWLNASRWKRAAFGSLLSWRRLVLVAAAVGCLVLVVVAGVTLNHIPVPWLVQSCESYGSACTPQMFAEAVRADAIGNFGIMGFGFSVALLNSLGGSRNTAFNHE